MYANDSGSCGESQHSTLYIDSFPDNLNTIDPLKIISVLVRDCDESDRKLMREVGTRNGITIEQAKPIFELGQSGTSRRLLRLFGDKSRHNPVNPPLLHRRKFKGTGAGKTSYEYYYAPYVNLDLVEQAIARIAPPQSNPIQLETKVSNQQIFAETAVLDVPEPIVDAQSNQILVQAKSESELESNSTERSNSDQGALSEADKVSQEDDNLSNEVEELAKVPQVSDSTENFEERVARMFALMAQKIKHQEQEINALKNRVAGLDKKPLNQTEIFDAVEAELKNLYVPVELVQNGKNGTIK
jgi:hypothetical protein